MQNTLLTCLLLKSVAQKHSILECNHFFPFYQNSSLTAAFNYMLVGIDFVLEKEFYD